MNPVSALLSNLFHDLRLALRQFRRAPGFTLTAVVTLALGIGAATAVFSIVDAVLLEPLPFPNPERIVALDTLTQARGAAVGAAATLPNSTSYPNFFDWRDRARSFSAMATWQHTSLTLGAAGTAATRIDGLVVTSDFFRVLGIHPALGRDFVREDERPGGRNVLVGDSLWRTTLNANPAAIGGPLQLSDETYTVVGVLPAGFHFPNAPDAQVFISPSHAMEGANASGTQRGWRQNDVIARLAPGISLEQARAELLAVQLGLVREYPDNNATDTGVSVVPQLADLTGQVAGPMHLLFAAVGLLLLIACANVAGLMLTRVTARRPELALRAAIGATRGQIVRQLVLEALALSLLGGVCGLLLAALVLRVAPRFLPDDLPRLEDLSLNPRVFLFALAASLLTGLLFGVLPAWRSSQVDLSQALRESARTNSGSRSQNRLQAALVVGETALGLVLLIGAGLLIRSFNHLLSVDPGFNPQHLLTFRVGLPPKRFEEARLVAKAEQLQSRFAAVPGIRSATYGYPVPFSGGDMSITFSIPGHPTAPGESPSARVSIVPSSFFPTLQLPLLHGRLFTPADDRADAPPVVIVDEAFAARFFPGEDAVGKHVASDISSDDKGVSKVREIVGVVANVKRNRLDEKPQPSYYVPFAQAPVGPPSFVLRVDGDTAAPVDTIRRLVAEQDATLPVYGVRTSMLTRSTGQQRFAAQLISGFALLALLLSSIGLYAVLSYMVAQRTMELGLRMALGAQRADVLLLVVRRGLLLAVLGVVLGVVAAVALGRFIAALLFHTPALDGLTFVSTSALLLFISALAALVPAARASRLNPIETLRNS